MAIVESWEYMSLAMEDDPDDYRPDSTLAFIIDPAQSSEGFVQGITVFDEKIAPGDRSPLHLHTIEEVLFVDEGRVEVRLGARRQLVTPRAVVFIPAGVAHGFRNVEGPAPKSETRTYAVVGEDIKATSKPAALGASMKRRS